LANKSKKIECPACGSIDFKQMFSAEDYLVSHKNFDILHCTNCSLRITSPRPSVSEINKYYKSEEYISHNEDGKTLINKIYKIVQKVSLIKKRRIVEKSFGNKKGTLLDIGCGTGDFLKVMKNADWEVSGVEPDEGARRIAQESTASKVYSVEQHFNDNTKYDVITMWHSLEHVNDINEQISKIDELLNEDGMLYIAVPNYTSFDAEFYKQNWAAYDVPRHLFHFSPQSLQALINKHGFTISSFKQLPFDPFYISLMSELSVLKNKKIIRANWIGLRSYLSGLFNSKNGSSILYTIKRKS